MFDFSPIGSRPPSPKSDTEYETQKYDVQSQTLLTGDDLKEDDVQWRWGELPEKTPETTHHHPVLEASQTPGASNGTPGWLPGVEGGGGGQAGRGRGMYSRDRESYRRKLLRQPVIILC